MELKKGFYEETECNWGLTIKIHMVTDGLRKPLLFCSPVGTKTHLHDQEAAETLRPKEEGDLVNQGYANDKFIK